MLITRMNGNLSFLVKPRESDKYVYEGTSDTSVSVFYCDFTRIRKSRNNKLQYLGRAELSWKSESYSSALLNI